jgi:hypothetical protein
VAYIRSHCHVFPHLIGLTDSVMLLLFEKNDSYIKVSGISPVFHRVWIQPVNIGPLAHLEILTGERL